MEAFHSFEACSLDMKYLVKALAEGGRTDLITSAIAHYSSKMEESLESATASWMKKRSFVETLIAILPPDKDSVSCNFLLRLLRVANMVHVESTHKSVLEERISSQLDQASLKEFMIPSFKHTSGTLFDVELAIRLFRMFSNGDDVSKRVAPLIKVAKLMDSYLAEVSVDSNLELTVFSDLCTSIPKHARATDDGLYLAVITYLKAHPALSKQEKMIVCGVIDFGKLSEEATRHSVVNNWLPVRCMMQILYAEQMRVKRKMDWKAFPSNRSPLEEQMCHTNGEGKVQQFEMRKLREEVRRLQHQCNAMEVRLERVEAEKKVQFWWKKLRIIPSFSRGAGGHAEKKITGERRKGKLEDEYMTDTPMNT